MKTMKLGYVIQYVPDVEKAVAFYEKAFGIERQFVHEGGQFAQMNTGATALAFCSEELAAEGCSFEPVRLERKGPGIEIGFLSDQVEAAFDRAVSAGATPVLAPIKKPWGQTVAYVRDLNGFLVEMCTPMG